MVARGPGPHRGLGKPEREDPARVEGPAPGVRIHMFIPKPYIVRGMGRGHFLRLIGLITPKMNLIKDLPMVWIFNFSISVTQNEIVLSSSMLQFNFGRPQR